MIWHPIFAFVTGFLNSLYAALPVWTFHFGHGCADGAQCPPGASSAGSDGGALHFFLHFLGLMDRFIPLHDGVFIVLGVQFAILVGLNIIKGVKWGLSLIPTISSAG